MDSRLEVIKQRMIASGIPQDEVDTLIKPLASELERRVCGLVWKHEGATTKLIEDMEGRLPVLTPVKDKNIIQDVDGLNHILIEGENLLALMAMQYTHIDENRKGLIDAIYIDPPYNTESTTMVYNDKFEKSEWLSMMNVRLRLAKNILKLEGVIMISIDDKYEAELKLLLDEIFGTDNMVSIISVKRPSDIATSVSISKTEYCLVYARDMFSFAGKEKNKDKIVEARGTVGNEKQTQPVIEFPAGLRCDNIPDGVYSATRKIEGSLENIENLNDIIVENGRLASPVKLKARWRSSNDMRNFFKNQCKPTKAKISGLITEIYFKNDRFVPYIKKDSWEKIESLFLDNKKGSTEVRKLGVNFSYPKHTALLKTLFRQLNLCSDAVILDFFAGSGTTAHAVLDLNKEDNACRKFILCTNNELGKDAIKSARSNNIVHDMPEYEDYGVCRAVTYPRIKTVMTSHHMDNYSEGIKGNNLYYYRISDDVEESSIAKVTKDTLAKQAVSYIALKEGIFNVEEHGGYHILSNKNSEVLVVIDPMRDYRDVHENIANRVFTKEHRKVYCSLKRRTVVDHIEYIPYPEEVLDVLKSIKKRVAKEAKR